MMEFSMVRTIEHTRRGEPLGAEAVRALVAGITQGTIPDYQTAAWLMAVLWRGLTPDDLTTLTIAMARSGATLDLSSIGHPIADKHSTGGVGDKATLVVAPIVAACGVPVAKMSGRGLGHTGGTVDKLESIPGFNPELTVATFTDVLRRCDLVIAGQSADLAPADGILYALRDVTGTVPSIPLIASSIMAKKLAIGADAILLDVKVGRGAFMETMADATALAETMVRIGTDAGKRTAAVISDMDRPLGRAVGNALEVIEAVETLRGGGPDDLRSLALHEAALLLVMTGKAVDEAAGARMAERAIASGAAFERFAAVVGAQDGDRRALEETARLPHAPIVQSVPAPESGFIAEIEPLAIGRAAMRLGAGRARKGDTIDPAVGIVLRATVGERVERGAPLFDIHARDATQAATVRADALAGYRFSAEPAIVPPLIKTTIPASIC